MDWSRYLSQQGRKGDSLIAHITPEEAVILKVLGGAGTINPRTGLREFYDGDDGDDEGTGEDPGSVMGDIGGLSMGVGPDETTMPTFEQAYGKSGNVPGSTLGEFGYSTLASISTFFDNMTLSQAVGYGLSAAGIAAAFGTGGLLGVGYGVGALAHTGFTATTGVNPSLATPVMAMISEVTHGLGQFGTPESKEATAQAFNEMNEQSMNPNPSNVPTGFDVASTPVGQEMAKNEETLDVLMNKFGEIGDYGSAVKVAKTFENQIAIRTKLESEIFRYSGDPEYQKIEPEFRVEANAALDKGMEPKAAADSAFKKVKEAYLARNFIREYLDRNRKKLEMTA